MRLVENAGVTLDFLRKLFESWSGTFKLLFALHEQLPYELDRSGKPGDALRIKFKVTT